ncbi:serine/threonine protein kinase [Paenibacillus lentus]|uniref:Serine/threonine protein kinase n=1 Tax=Paenibacillus lentus TaxID=1338368 RepID=A0A3S8RQ76_9BACL|nr:serine/threonine protein kinase [Paenibacillus lentus]AZK45088.1 serine/threonine protein kinase [Paenibacillus lentus]
MAVTVQLQNRAFELQSFHDFAWLDSMGEIIAVFDQQDSGNISFGIKQEDGQKTFVKYAGAETVNYQGDVKEAIFRLQQAMTVYEDLMHPSLVKLVTHFATKDGYAAVFEWFDGENLHPHWSFPPPAKYTDPDSPYYQYRQLSIEQRLSALDVIFSFHAAVEQRGYVAVDFYDGSIMYDFKLRSTRVCDIDLYRKGPFINTMGRMWGSSRFMSPEEFEKGAVIDGITNVFNMGAAAFALLGGELDRSLAKWEAGPELYEVALKAVEPERQRRYSSVAEFNMAWKQRR